MYFIPYKNLFRADLVGAVSDHRAIPRCKMIGLILRRKYVQIKQAWERKAFTYVSGYVADAWRRSHAVPVALTLEPYLAGKDTTVC